MWILIDGTPNSGVFPQSAIAFQSLQVLFHAFCPGFVVILSERQDINCGYSILFITGTLGIILFRVPLNLGIRFQVSDCQHVKVLIRSQDFKFAMNPAYLHKYFPLSVKKQNEILRIPREVC